MSLTNPSQLVLKHQNRLPQQLLLLNADGDALPQALIEAGKSVHILTPDFLNHQQLSKQCPAAHNHFGVDGQGIQADAAILRIPKAREQLRYLAALACAVLPQGAPVYLVGENKGGIRSAGKTVAPFLGNCGKLASGNHCQLLEGHTQSDQALDMAQWWLPYEVSTPDGPLSLASLPGVFSHGELDEGTELLLQHLPEHPVGRVLDFGCGDGVIGAFLARRNPAIELEMVDINAMALAASQQTLAQNGLTGKVYPSNGLSGVEGQFDLIVSNPPFHHGATQTFDTARQFIRDAAKALKPGGQLIIVANHHLPYGDDFAHVFGRVQIVAANNKFKIYADSKNN
ncbi:methyltransferase [Ferrimonas balearica]|uniref:methyltransferase n=1 Tax=Ferrimonas balearica TaxID=44012 RepID=UPI001C57634B|nr:methyltransferase [Ferrimonas balearica]MBW3140608.1 methyltransferase [Ferrimonas balearica]MBW3165415.1 methyltransferase [Ferrimonas balearica]MBY6107589.1 methyltransferase [Ferrimonas balearica]